MDEMVNNVKVYGCDEDPDIELEVDTGSTAYAELTVDDGYTALPVFLARAKLERVMTQLQDWLDRNRG